MFIVIGGIFEIVWAVSMKYSDGFADLFWTAAAVIFIILSMFMLSAAIHAGMPLGTAYAVWVGIGAIGTFVFGIIFMQDPAGTLRILFVALIVAGIIGLQRTSK